MRGANGAGKTTTVNCFLGFSQPTGGQALINGIDVQQQPLETKKYIAYIPENVMLYRNMTGLENLRYFSKLGGHEYDEAKYCTLLAAGGLHSAAVEQTIDGCSKGTRQTVGMAIGLAKKGRASLSAEPTLDHHPQPHKQ